VSVLLGVLTGIILAFPVKWLWNWVMVDIFKLIEISAWQAWGLVLLLNFLIPRGQVNSNVTKKNQN
jgi:hypothetical protein